MLTERPATPQWVNLPRYVGPELNRWEKILVELRPRQTYTAAEFAPHD